MAKRKSPPTLADQLYGLLMQQEFTGEKMDLAASAVGSWLGAKAGTLSDDDFAALVGEAMEELRTCAWDMRSQELAPTPSRDVAG